LNMLRVITPTAQLRSASIANAVRDELNSARHINLNHR